jgi:choline dehydrogenase-like flavoprotein
LAVADQFDAVVVGSGATGSWAAKELTEAGLRVALLDAGPLRSGDATIRVPRRVNRFIPDHPPRRGDRRRHPVQSHCFAFNEGTAHLFVDDLENPYTCPDEAPFDWVRSRQVGGRLLIWGRVAVRMSDAELKAASNDGIGVDWPVSYADLAPHYERVEAFMRVCGERHGLGHLPDGAFLDPPPPVPGEADFRAAVEGRWPDRRVTSTRATQCPPDAMLAAARQTGRLTLLPDTIASRVLTNPRTGKAASVAVVDRISGSEGEIAGRVIVLCASAIESTRLLLNSANADHPGGLGNSSGLLGHYLMDHTYGIGLDGLAPGGLRDHADRLSNGCMMSTFRGGADDGVDFVRGYGTELQVIPVAGGRLPRLLAGRRRRDGWFWIRTLGEVLPEFENRVSLDPEIKDAWGIPAARVECRYGENERRMAADQLRSVREMVEAAGWQVENARTELAPPGLSSHELGTARMGNDPATSVLNSHNQSWDVPNLYLTDGSCFPSGGFQNPTLTMMALTVRACRHIAAELTAGDL